LQHRLDPGNIPKIGFEKLPKSFALKSLTLCTVEVTDGPWERNQWDGIGIQVGIIVVAFLWK